MLEQSGVLSRHSHSLEKAFSLPRLHRCSPENPAAWAMLSKDSSWCVAPWARMGLRNPRDDATLFPIPAMLGVTVKAGMR